MVLSRQTTCQEVSVSIMPVLQLTFHTLRTSQVAPLDVDIVIDHAYGLLLTLCTEASLATGSVLQPLDSNNRYDKTNATMPG